MRTSHILKSLVVLGVLLSGCARETEVIEPAPEPVAGKGGYAVLRITPQHHLKNIDSCTVYIKYDASAMPANMIFDDSIKNIQKDGRPMAIFTSLNKGNYYVYGRGWDPDIAEDVTGGAYFRVIDTMTKTYDIYLAVTEKH